MTSVKPPDSSRQADKADGQKSPKKDRSKTAVKADQAGREILSPEQLAQFPPKPPTWRDRVSRFFSSDDGEFTGFQPAKDEAPPSPTDSEPPPHPMYGDGADRYEPPKRSLLQRFKDWREESNDDSEFFGDQPIKASADTQTQPSAADARHSMYGDGAPLLETDDRLRRAFTTKAPSSSNNKGDFTPVPLSPAEELFFSDSSQDASRSSSASASPRPKSKKKNKSATSRTANVAKQKSVANPRTAQLPPGAFTYLPAKDKQSAASPAPQSQPAAVPLQGQAYPPAPIPSHPGFSGKPQTAQQQLGLPHDLPLHGRAAAFPQPSPSATQKKDSSPSLPGSTPAAAPQLLPLATTSSQSKPSSSLPRPPTQHVPKPSPASGSERQNQPPLFPPPPSLARSSSPTLHAGDTPTQAASRLRTPFTPPSEFVDEQLPPLDFPKNLPLPNIVTDISFGTERSPKYEPPRSQTKPAPPLPPPTPLPLSSSSAHTAPPLPPPTPLPLGSSSAHTAPPLPPPTPLPLGSSSAHTAPFSPGATPPISARSKIPASVDGGKKQKRRHRRRTPAPPTPGFDSTTPAGVTSSAPTTTALKPTRVGLGITALPSAGFSGSPPTPPAQTTPLPATQQQKQFRVPIKWGTRVYNATVTAPANLTAAQVAAAIAVQLDQIQDPNFKSGMPKLDLTFDGLAVTASLPGAAAGSPTYVVDQTKFPDVAKYTAAMQTGVVAPELAADQTFSRYQQEYSSAASRTAPAQPLSQSQRTAPASPVTHIGFQNVGNTCYVNAPLQAIAHNESLRSYLLKDGAIPDLSQQQVAANPHLKRLLDHYQIQAKQDGSYPHPLKLILAAYEYRLNPQSPQFGQPINPSVLIDYLRLLNKIDARGIQGDAHEAFSAIMAEVNPNLPGSPIAAQQRERAVRSDSVPSRPRTPDAMNFPLISLTPAGGTEGLPLQVQLDGYFHDESVAHDQASQYRRIHRGFTSAPELLGIYANRRTANGSKNTIPIQATERLSLAQSWVDGQPAPLPYDFDSMVYHNGLTGDRGHYVTIVREIDGAGVVTFKELSDSSPARIITDPAELAGMANTASLLFYQRPGAAPVNVPAHQSPRATTPPASRTGSGQHPSTSPRSQPRHASTSHRAPPSRKHRQGPMNPKLKQAYEGILSSERDPSADDDV